MEQLKDAIPTLISEEIAPKHAVESAPSRSSDPEGNACSNSLTPLLHSPLAWPQLHARGERRERLLVPIFTGRDLLFEVKRICRIKH